VSEDFDIDDEGELTIHLPDFKRNTDNVHYSLVLNSCDYLLLSHTNTSDDSFRTNLKIDKLNKKVRPGTVYGRED